MTVLQVILASILGIAVHLSVSGDVVADQDLPTAKYNRSHIFQRDIPNDVAEAAARVALKRVHKSSCGSKGNCAPATDAELNKPPLRSRQIIHAMRYGILGAYANWCGLDGSRSIVSLVDFARQSHIVLQRKLALLDLIQARMMENTDKILKRSGHACPADLRADLDASLPKLPKAPPPKSARVAPASPKPSGENDQFLPSLMRHR